MQRYYDVRFYDPVTRKTSSKKLWASSEAEIYAQFTNVTISSIWVRSHHLEPTSTGRHLVRDAE